MFYNYEEVINTIQNTRRFGNYTGYEVSKDMLEQLGNPQSGIPFVHVAGTNGKGSTTAFLTSILEQTGKRIGMFTSPHLITFRERIRINGEYISKEDVTRLGNQLLNTEFSKPPTMFDYCLAMAVLYFKEQQCDMMVIETGIGGRYDSTNALGVPEVAVITKIGLDHTNVLGDTIEAIAQEKAGIIKPGCSVVIHPQQTEAREVLLSNYRSVNQLSHEDVIAQVESQGDENATHTTPAIHEVSSETIKMIQSIPMKMQGAYQIENAAAASLASKIILAKWWQSDNEEVQVPAKTQSTEPEKWIENCIRAGIQNTFWKGRMEILNTDPFFMIDGAHNAHGVHALATSLKELYPNEKFHFIMGVMADKDYEDMIDELLPLAIDFVTVTPESERALQSKDLAKCIAEKGVKATYAEDMEMAICPLLPQKNTREGQTIITAKQGETHIYLPGYKTIAFGSLYFIGAIEDMLERNKTED